MTRIIPADMRERWLPILVGVLQIPSGYEVSDLGRVRRISTGRVLKAYRCPKRNGTYWKVDLFTERCRRSMSVHRLVATAFVPNPLGKPEVNHFDLDTANNRADNLEWATREEQERHKRFMEATA